MRNAIILSSCLFGSFYLCSESLKIINMMYLKNKTPSRGLFLLNGFTFVFSGSTIIYTVLRINGTFM